MRKIDIAVETPVVEDFRVKQVSGMFGLDVAGRARRAWSVEVPTLDEPWLIGAIVGPSGSGKSVVARHVSDGALSMQGGFDWPRDKAVVSAFPDAIETKRITAMFTSVGFGSTPQWVKPYGTLSNGEQFRADLARALLTPSPCLWFDEFTSVVDRQVAQVGSAAVAKTIRAGRTAGGAERFVAVTCHYDILPWLDPDWVLDMATGETVRRWVRLERRRLVAMVGRRPRMRLTIHRCRRDIWNLFREHHYLNTKMMHSSARCYVGMLDDRPVAFVAIMPQLAKREAFRIARVVVLPEFQSLGIGGRMCTALGEIYTDLGCKLSVVAGHPAIIASFSRSPHWRCHSFKLTGEPAHGMLLEGGGRATSFGRSVAGFTYVGTARGNRRRRRVRNKLGYPNNP